jgi:hypothetical protein
LTDAIRLPQVIEKILAQDLLNLFRSYNTATSLGIIDWIISGWAEAIQRGEVTLPAELEAKKGRGWYWDARQWAGDIYLSISERAYDGPRERMQDPNRQITRQEMQDLGLKWAKKLTTLPFAKTRETFATAVHEWLLTCDVNSYNLTNWNDSGVVGYMLSDLYLRLGLD